MIAPSVAAGRFLRGLVLGAVLGLLYGFLRPLGRRRRTFADFLFLLGAFPIWLYFSFAVCDGDMGLGYISSLFLGGIFFDCTIGRLFRPIWSGFWRFIGAVFQKKRKFFRKITTFLKKIEEKCEQRRTPLCQAAKRDLRFGLCSSAAPG